MAMRSKSIGNQALLLRSQMHFGGLDFWNS